MRWLKNTHLCTTGHLQNIQVCMYSCTILWCCCTQHQHCSCVVLWHIRQHLKIHFMYLAATLLIIILWWKKCILVSNIHVMNKRITFSHDIGKRLPLQVCPSPEYPGLHVQLYDPLVLLQTASALQLCFPLAHSLSSSKSGID